MPDLRPRPLPLLTLDLPGTGGEAKATPEDFVVEELPAYAASGAGEHLYLWVEKRDASTSEVAKLIARALGMNERDVGYAGQKDRRAVTRQWFSALTTKAAPVSDDPRWKVLSSSRHGNKLRLGHLTGNRFLVALSATNPDSLPAARAVLERLSRDGLANFYGSQRFGRRGDNAEVGAALLGLGTHPEAQRASRDRHLKRLVLSAMQSELFNRCLTARIADGLFSKAIEGDVLRKRESGGVFTSTDPVVDTERVVRGELDVTGPMPGVKERPATAGEARAREDAILAEAGIPREAFAKEKGELEGARRPYRVPVGNPTAGLREDGALVLAFSLPAGSYATRVLAEVTKADLALPGES